MAPEFKSFGRETRGIKAERLELARVCITVKRNVVDGKHEGRIGTQSAHIFRRQARLPIVAMYDVRCPACHAIRCDHGPHFA